MSWDVSWRYGSICLPQIGWWLDAHRPVSRAFVSHAHFDHLALHQEIICSEGTARLMRDRLPAKRIERILPFGHTEPLTPGCTITLHPAGHIFGSAQCLLEHEQHGRLLYTGDFKLRQGASAETCSTPRADVVIMETTFGRPHYTFPPTAKVLADIVAFCRGVLEDGDVPLLFGYSLGKSQEVLGQLAAANLPLMLHPQVVRMTAVYEELGYTFPPYEPLDPAAAAGHVIIAPPQAANARMIRQIKRRRTAMLSGWAVDPGAVYRYQCDAAFPLSDHADYPDLLAFVERVQPRQVWTTHGFAADFARDLRARGIEAWALGTDNQLEISLGISEPASTAVSTVAEPAPSEAPPDAFQHLADTAEAIKAAPGKLRKTELLVTYLRSLPLAEAARAALYLTGRPFAQNSDQRLQTGWAAMQRAVLAVTGHNRGEWRTAYRRFADSGDTAEALLAGCPHLTPTTPPPSLAQIAERLAAIAAARGPQAKIELLESALRSLTPREAKYLLKIISGDLRIGLREGLVEEAVATAYDRPLADVRRAHMLCGDISAVALAAGNNTLDTVGLRLFQPIQFMLASPEPDAEGILSRLAPPVWVEDKFDGIRCQLHKQGDRVELYSRDLNRITDQFPDLVRDLKGWSHDVILDGELLAWRGDRALPFAELQKRLGRGGDDLFLGSEIPISYSAYDLLHADGTSLLAAPLRQRRETLDTLFRDGSAPSRLRLAPRATAADAAEIDRHFLAARDRGNEGLMLKDPASLYAPGRRGHAWLKLKKAFATLDVVVVAVEQGHGKRRGVLSDYTFAVRDDRDGASADALLVLGKAYSGLTDAEIAELTDHFTAQTLEVQGRKRRVHPDTVIEIAFDSLQPSKRHDSGYALRFPRIARVRSDKTIADIDTLSTCARLAGDA
ncbi:ATP-dependent DNA ligase [Actomonas aquatica]|uniref:DNA ligase n=1 Tax=Actomonas aquatica TaxID=2866162 RepID=A0ABZ1C9Q4_9BACT|nr:ATP-dependent DNA ligase [Opitutus sp. WL0086]WRQ88027.1 ATP-dependent DNA ligase [Opitutus sp. WL0086]